MIHLDSILVATDFGETSEDAFAYGRDLARMFGGHLHVLHVTESVLAATAAQFYPALDLQEQADTSAKKRLDALLSDDDRTRLHAQAIIRSSAAPADAIVAYAKAANVDVIVLGTHGRGPVSRFFVGSVAETVVRTAPCPVLVVRPTLLKEVELIVPDLVAVDTRLRCAY